MKISSLFKPLSFLPALLLMYMIYSFSSQPGDVSSSVSFKVSEKIVAGYSQVTQQNWDSWQINQKAEEINLYVRKGAHMSEYFLLAVAVSFPLYVYGIRGILLMLLAGLICVGYACGDEYHQSFVAGRSPSPRDVGIDSIGVFIGIILVRLLGWSARVSVTGPRLERKQRKRQEELDRREEELRYREEMLRRREYEDRQAGAFDRYPGDRFSPENREGYKPYGQQDREGYEPYGPENREGYEPYSPENREVYEPYSPEDREEYGSYGPADRTGSRRKEYDEIPPEKDPSDEDTSDVLSEDIPLFHRRKHGKSL